MKSSRLLILLLVFLFLLWSGLARAGNATLEGDIHTFVRILASERLSLAQCFTMYGNSSEFGEGELNNAMCRHRGWRPIEGNLDCRRFIRTRHYRHPDKVPCLFWTWLKARLPLSEDIEILEARVKPPEFAPDWEVTARIGKSIVTLVREVDWPGKMPGPKVISIKTIDGRSIWSTLERDTQNMGVLLERMGLDENAEWPDAPLTKRKE